MGPCEELRKIEDPQLQSLVRGLKEKSSTIRKYVGAFDRWKRWTSDMEGIQAFPVIPLKFALYLQHITVHSQSKAAVEEAVNAVSWVNQAVGWP